MKSEILKLNLKDVVGAVLSAAIVAVLTYIATLTSIIELDLMVMVNIAVLTGVTSLLKAIGTDKGGDFLGAVPVK